MRGLAACSLLLLCLLTAGCMVGRLIPAGVGTTGGGIPTVPGTYTLTVTARDSVSLAQHSVPLTVIIQ